MTYLHKYPYLYLQQLLLYLRLHCAFNCAAWLKRALTFDIKHSHTHTHPFVFVTALWVLSCSKQTKPKQRQKYIKSKREMREKHSVACNVTDKTATRETRKHQRGRGCGRRNGSYIVSQSSSTLCTKYKTTTATNARAKMLQTDLCSCLGVSPPSPP